MGNLRMIMYLSLMPDAMQVYSETRFRPPSALERAMGLWVDRVGAAASGGGAPGVRRLLGQYAAVAVEEGHGIFESPSAGRQRVTSQDVLLLFPDEPHRYYGTPTWMTRWVVWNGPEAARVTSWAGFSPAAPVLRQAAPAVARAFASIHPLMAAADVASALERKQRVLGLLAALVRHSTRSRHPREDALDALIRDLTDATDGRLPIPRLAASCHLSVAQFRRLFHQRTGRSPLAFLTALRMARARDLLAAGVPMKDVAAQTGYGDVFHFMRVFHQATGQTAGRFAAANRARA